MLEKNSKNNYVILLDFDGTVVKHEYPYIGEDIGAARVLKKLIENGCQFVLFTMRDGDELKEAVEWFNKNKIPLYGIQENPTQKTWTTSPKAYGHLIIDDTCLGIDLIYNDADRPYVDWRKTSEKLMNKGLLSKEQFIELYH